MRQLLKDIAVISAGQGAPQGEGNYCDEGTPFVKAGNLLELLEGKSIFDIQKVSEKVAKEYRLKLYKKGTVLFAKSGMSCLKGYVYVLPCDAYVVSHLACITPKQDLSQYLLYYFNFHKPNKLVKDESYPSISLSDIGNLEIDIKDSTERTTIIETLSKTRLVINARQKELAKLDELVKARFVEMFGNPVINEMRWKHVALSSCIDNIDSGKSYVCGSYPRNGNWPAILKLSAVTYGTYHPEENKAMLDDKYCIEKIVVKPGDLLFTRKNTPDLVGMCAYVYDTPDNLMMPDLIFRLNTNGKVNKLFLWKLINHDLFRKCIQAIASGSAKSMSNISKERLLNLDIILPPLELQEQFATFVKQVDKSKFVIQKALNETQTLFDSLMQKYFG